ncbi:MAG: hypothetical protein KF851_08120 [Pirellulaceae bacterium]|nr:hypothetical protein [Pirellulaceae bacterium]
MPNYKLEGNYLRHRSGNLVAEVDAKLIRDSSGNRIGEIDGDYIRDSRGNRVADFDGSYIRDGSGNRIGEMRDVQQDIDGIGGMTLIALWVLCVR